MRNAYISALETLAKQNKEVMALVADNGIIVYDKFREECPENFLNFGIAEATMVGAAAGLASCGKIPFVYTIIPFVTMRAFEQIRNDVCLQQKNVKLVGIGAGLSYSTLGPTHHGTEDMSIMRVLPNLTIISPATPLETMAATYAAAQLPGPVYLRLGNFKGYDFYADADQPYEFVVGRALQVTEGNDLTIIATGGIVNEAVKAAEELQQEGIHIRILNMHTIKPLDIQAIVTAAAETKAILTLEEHSVLGGLGGAVAESLLENYSKPLVFARMGLDNAFGKGYGSYDALRRENQLHSEAIKSKVQAMLTAKQQL